MKVLIIGAKVSALSAYNLAINVNDIPYLLVSESEKNSIKNYNYYLNEELEIIINQFEIFIISPGVYYDDKRFIILKKYNKRIISEIEYAYQNLKEKPFIIGVTGSNGKTTIVEGIYHCLTSLGYNAYKAGNIGIPFSNVAISMKENDILILELSNFQLDYISEFHPNIAIISNITPNHLDHVINYDSYINSKLNIYKNMDNYDYLIYPILLKELISFKGNQIILNNSYNHYEYNKAIIGQVVSLVEQNKYLQIINNFKGVKYRLEKISDSIYHDGKSTTPESTISAIKAINNNENLVVILGGRNKNLSFENLLNIKVKCFIVYGELAKQISHSNLIKVDTLKDSINEFKKIKDEKTILLYSPACSSFDQYSSYLERCEEFSMLIKELQYE